MKMKALKTFLGKPGEGVGHDKVVKRAAEFNVESEARAKDLEKLGMAQRLAGQGRPAQPTKVKPNKAAGDGPLPSAGGKTGAAGSPSSSLPGLQPSVRVKRSPKRRGAKAGADQA